MGFSSEISKKRGKNEKIKDFIPVKLHRIFKMKKYLLLIEDEKLWERFKELLDKDINTEILDLIKKKVKNEKEK